MVASAGDEWAVLGHELGCWKLSAFRKAWADDEGPLAKVRSFQTPDEFVAELRRLGMKPKTETGDWNGHPVVSVTVDGRIDVRFISRRYCSDAPYDIEG